MVALNDPRRLLTVSCFEAYRVLRDYAKIHPKLTNEDLVSIIKKTFIDSISLDFEAALILFKILKIEIPNETIDFYRLCIREILIHFQPKWLKPIKYGRKNFAKELNTRNLDVFEISELLLDPPPTVVISWWDGIADVQRKFDNDSKMQQSRAAEQLTLELENKRLKQVGIHKELEWPGFENHYAGYDVLSYELINTQKGSEVTNKLIEVKSSISNPIIFYVTRNEWDTAEKAGEKYIFHVWDMRQKPPILHEFLSSQVAPHIPKDNKSGQWQNAKIVASKIKKSRN